MADRRDPKQTYAKRDSKTSIFHITLGGSAVRVSPESPQTLNSELAETPTPPPPPPPQPPSPLEPQPPPAADVDNYNSETELEYMTTMSNLEMPAVISPSDVAEQTAVDPKPLPSIEVPNEPPQERKKKESISRGRKHNLDGTGVGVASNEEEEEEAGEEQHDYSISAKTRFNPGIHSKDKIAAIVLAYWKQLAHETAQYRASPTRQQIKDYVASILSQTEVDNKEKVHQEAQFIIQHFRQRRCRNFCQRPEGFYDRTTKVLQRAGMLLSKDKQHCVCGLEKKHHTEYALRKEVNSWEMKANTEIIWPWNFGNMDIPGHYNYLELPRGTRKYIRVDDLHTDPRSVWDLLTKHWGLKQPNMVISVTGGDISRMQENPRVYQKFRDGILKSAVKTRAWIFTEGLHYGSSREIGDIFQEDLKRSEWAEIDDHASIPLIAIVPWGILADRKQLQGINMGSDEARYYFNAVQHSTNVLQVPNSLDPYHVLYLMADDGTSGQYNHEPKIRQELERFIKSYTSLEILGANKAIMTPLVILVVGGDKFTLQKVRDATCRETQIPVVIVNGSGAIADMLADIYKALEHRRPRSASKEYGWSEDETTLLNEYLQKYKKMGLIKTSRNDEHLIKEAMQARHLIEVFGVSEGDITNLDKAILLATFGGILEISAQLNLTLAMDRCDIAREAIFVESRKPELGDQRDMLQNALLQALKSHKTDFVQLLLDQDFGGELEFDEFLTLRRLHILHEDNMRPTHVMGKVLRSLAKRDISGTHVLEGGELLPQVGRIIHHLLGKHYKLLYQEKEYRKVEDALVPFLNSKNRWEEAVWHLFLWAVLANNRDIAELFLFESSCKIGAALMAYKILMRLASVAELWAEVELTEDLRRNANYFQDLAIETLNNLYEFNRDEAYASLVSVLPFKWGRFITPLTIADDGEAMRFIGSSCCQTFLHLVWLQYMDLDTAYWKLVPLFALVPWLNLPFIVFDKNNLSFGSYKERFIQENQQSKALENVPEAVPSASMRNLQPLEVPADDNESVVSQVVSETGFIDPQKRRKWGRKLKFAWFCVKSYYTAPVNKFLFNLVSYMTFLGLFTHFLLTELRPVDTVDDVTVYEWLVMLWAVCITMEEARQLVRRNCTGPLYGLRWRDFEPEWQSTWYLYERIFLVLRLYRLELWLSDRWNKIDAVMLLCYYSSVALRFTLPKVDFEIVRIMFSISLIIFYFRILRLGYILKDLGPRIITIKAMVADLFQFIMILAVFIVSFGVAFQALLNPNKPSSWSLVVDVIWRPYWQMYGELFLDDVDTEMGRGVNERNCTKSRDLAEANPDTLIHCYNWMVPILLGVYMLITNILLLNLLIAIFSHSFETIESESRTIWRYHMYDLVHEYYNMVWLPPPLNALCHVMNVILWLLRWPRKWCYVMAKKRHRQHVKSTRSLLIQTPLQADKKAAIEKQRVDKEAEDALQQDFLYFFYYDDKRKQEHETDHFRQEDYMRDEDLEEKAYKRYMRAQQKKREDATQRMLYAQDKRLQVITSDLQDLKHFSSATRGLTEEVTPPPSPTSERITPRRVNSRSTLLSMQSTEPPSPSRNQTTVIKKQIDHLAEKVDGINVRMTHLMQDLGPVIDYIKGKRDSKHRGHTHRKQI